MGRPKAVLPIDGVPMGRWVVDALRAGGAETVIVVGGDPAWAATLGVAHRPDRWPGEGPLGGLATAVAEAGEDDIVVVAACDQPALTARVIASLVDRLDTDETVEACVTRTPDGRRQPFPSAWRAGGAGGLCALVEDGARRADAALASVRVAVVDVAAEVIADVDRPGDLDVVHPGHGAL